MEHNPSPVILAAAGIQSPDDASTRLRHWTRGRLPEIVPHSLLHPKPRLMWEWALDSRCGENDAGDSTASERCRARRPSLDSDTVN